MSGRPLSALERLWSVNELNAKPRLGLSLERVVRSGVELADDGGLAAVSMKRVAERLGFTTMSLYRHVASKDELLLHMHDATWQPPQGLETPVDGWRAGLHRWTQEQHVIMRQHPWLDEVRLIDRAGTPSQLVWMDLGLRTLAGTRLAEHRKLAVLLVLSGYVSSQARLASTAVDGARQGLFGESGNQTEAFSELLNTVVSPERFPALRAAISGGAFAVVEDSTYAPFEFGLNLILDGIGNLV